MTSLLDSIGYAGWALHALIWLPVLGIGLVLWAEEERAKNLAFWWSIGVFVLSLGLWWAFDPTSGAMQMETTAPWIPAWGVNYSLGIDGISLFMVLLTTFSTSIAILGSFNYIQTKQRAFYALMLLLEAAVVGVFVATDVFLFYVFFELTLVPMYFIVGIWGGERRIYAAIKFFLYTAFGSLLMLVGILFLFWKAKTLMGMPTFAYEDFLLVPLTGTEQLWLFGAFALAFSVKVPVFPFHTWLPDAHVEAPTPGSVILAAVLLKMGTYGFLRFLLPFFPLASQHPTVVTTMLVLAVIGILYTAWVAAVQPDAKKLVAYTSVAHMGFVVLGIFALNVNGLQGGLVVMISHGISTGALFLLLGMLYERRHTRTIAEFGGIARVAPWFATAFLITALASIGLPGTSGFVGEFLALMGAFESHPTLAFLATLGVIFAAYYMLPMVQTVFFNKLETDENRAIEDLNTREMVILAPLCALMIIIGWNPTPVLDRMEPSVRVVIERVEEAGARAAASDVLEAIPPVEVTQTLDPEDMNDGSAPAMTDGDE
ncbi:MAG: NADH-quinone oxidoreductase subunit M [Gemmatimonadota bacterium]|nr:NADH-quinone oxidoreductase subunit M [Gemmatimonadota bacterium]MDE3006449.1 NADH-quinone oxidoreductase subunit M [Gemmatimonadota bacterium]